MVTDLEPGHRYSFRCSAMSEQGSSGWGLTMQAETLPGLPFEVDSLHLVAAAPTSLTLRWSQPFGRGSRVTSYVLEMAITAVLEAAQAAHAAQQAAAAAQQQEQLHELAAAQGGQGAPALVQDQQQQPQTNGLYPSSSSGFDEDAHFWPAYQGPDSSCTGEGSAQTAKGWRWPPVAQGACVHLHAPSLHSTCHLLAPHQHLLTTSPAR